MKRLSDLPLASQEVSPETTGADVDHLFKADPQLAGVVVAGGEHDGAVLTRSFFYQQMSRRTGFEIFAHRPVTTILKHVPNTVLELPLETPVSEAVERAIEREPGMTYEPLRVRHEGRRVGLISFNQLVLAQSSVLESTMEEISEKNRQVQDSIRYAERIQHSMIFNQEQELPGYLDYYTIYRPRDIVSGDFYWVTEVGDTLFVAVADCTGHGVPGAFMSLIGHGHLSSLVQVEKLKDPAEILRQLHLRIRRSLHQERISDVAYDGMEIGLCSIDRRANTLCFSGAKRPLIVLREDGTLDSYKGDRAPIGGRQRERDRVFTQLDLSLDHGVTYYLFSDGWTDQCDPQQRKFGTKRLREMLSHVAPLNLPDQRKFLESALDLFQKDAPQRDDIALLAFRILP